MKKWYLPVIVGATLIPSGIVRFFLDITPTQTQLNVQSALIIWCGVLLLGIGALQRAHARQDDAFARIFAKLYHCEEFVVTFRETVLGDIVQSMRSGLDETTQSKVRAARGVGLSIDIDDAIHRARTGTTSYDEYAPPFGPVDSLGEDVSHCVGVARSSDDVKADANCALAKMEADRVFRQPGPYSGDKKGR